jgi:nucleoside-diphosphate-sugar epimerase
METIVVAGATGQLGGRIAGELLDRGARVRALVRTGTKAGVDKLEELDRRGVTLVQVDMANPSELTRACAGASCVVSTVQGLRDVIVEVQSALLEAAIAAGVPRFIPSDFSIDFTKQKPGENRNLDLRREFHERLDSRPIAATSIFNGAFAELLTSRMPLLDFDARKVSYWGDADQKLDFTTMDNTAAFTAAAAQDSSTPRFLRIAGDQISSRELAAVAGAATRSTFDLVRLGSVDDLAAMIARVRTDDPDGEKQVFPSWQGMQYMHNMFSGAAKLEPIDNDRYPGIRWTKAGEVISQR